MCDDPIYRARTISLTRLTCPVTYLICCCTGDYAGPADMMAEGPGSESVYRVGEVLFFALEDGEVGAEPTRPGSPCHDVHEVLADGHLYYSGSPWFDLTSRLSKRLADARHYTAACTPTPRRAASPTPSPPFRVADLPTDPRLLFNLVLLDPLHAFRNALSPREKTLFDARGFSVPVIQGFYGATVVDLGKGVKVTLVVCSRRGRRRAGTRFSKRGIDERGHVANFAEVSCGSCRRERVVDAVRRQRRCSSLRHAASRLFKCAAASLVRVQSSPTFRRDR